MDNSVNTAYRLVMSLMAAGAWIGSQNEETTPEIDQHLESELINFVMTAYTPAEA
tara:strand:- start:1114 stop:1278 length:165 start_codon:yes stop_codon:yes gene_type:complete